MHRHGPSQFKTHLKHRPWPFLLTILTLNTFNPPAPASAADEGCRTCLQSASGLFARGDNEGAARLLSQWQTKCPDNLQLFLMLNTVLMRLPDGKKRALAAAEQACTIAPNSMLAHFQKAMTLMTLQDGTAAAKEFERVVELDPTSYESWLALSDLLAAQGNQSGAKNAAEHASALSPSARQSQLNALTSKDRAGNIAGVKQEAARIIENPATTNETLLIVGEELLKLGYFDESIAAFERAKTKYPDAPQITTLLPYAVFEAGKISQCQKLLKANKGTAGGAMQALCAMAQGDIDSGEKLLAGAGNEPALYLARGYLALLKGQYKEAIENFSDCQQKNKAFSAVRLYTAQANLEAGDWKEALAETRASQQKAGGLKVRAEAIEMMCRLRDTEESSNNLPTLKSDLNNLAAKLSSRDQTAADCALAELALKDKDPGQAKTLATKGAALLEQCTEAHNLLARAALAEDDTKEALTQVEISLKGAPGNSMALALKALALLGSGNGGEAETLVTRAQSSAQLPAALDLSLGLAFQKGGQDKIAAQCLKRALGNGLNGAEQTKARDALKSLGASSAGK